MIKRSKWLTKSKYLHGLQCEKYVWIELNDKGQIPPYDATQQAVFDEGSMIGQMAKARFPGGIDIPEDDIFENITLSKTYLSAEQPSILYEPSVQVERFYARGDILVPNDDGSWDMYEVKKSGGLKQTHIDDIGFQRYAFEKAGIHIRRAFLMHINTAYVRHGEIDIEQFFGLIDVTDQLPTLECVDKAAVHILEVIDLETCPCCDIGDHCRSPYECPLKNKCWAHIPVRSVFELYYDRGKERTYDLYHKDILTLSDIPAEYDLTDKQRIQVWSAKHNKEYVDIPQIKDFLAQIEYPIAYIDYETVNPALPPYDGLTPYAMIPFQFSCHMQFEKGGDLEHFEFLADGATDPRKDFFYKQMPLLDKASTIFAFNIGFEKGRLREVAIFLGEEAWCEQVQNKFLDLITPFQKFHYYHPSQAGSASLKKVHPLFSSKSYDELDVADGGAAMCAFSAIMNGSLDQDEASRMRRSLLEYCKLDTFAMVEILNGLYSLVSA